MSTAVIIDDEYYSIEGLKIELELLGGIDVVGTYESCNALLQDIERLKPDIAFLDIEMPEMSGLELFSEIIALSPNTKIVFVTAYSDFAVEAFELNAVDYIIKPIQAERLKKTIERLDIQSLKPSYKSTILIECFGRMTILVAGKTVDISWRTKKSLELLCYLICNEGRYIAKEKLCELFWPETSPDKVKSNFHLASYHLKKSFEEQKIPLPLESKRGYVRLNMNEIEFETILFNHNINLLEVVTNANILIAEETLAMHRGQLFEEHYFSWIDTFQSKYDIDYFNLLEKVIVYYEHNDTDKYLHYKKIMATAFE